MTYAVAATWRAREGEEERIGEILAALAPACRQEPGCRVYQAHRSADDPRGFFIYEQYDDEEAFKAHTQSPHFEEYVRGQAVPLLERREASFYVTLD
jgi:quinol monooxygenase YgiN